MVHLLDGDTVFFNTVGGVLKGGTLAPFVFIIFLDYIFVTLTDLIKENVFTLKKTKCRWYPAEAMIDADYTDDQSLLVNKHARAKSLLNSLG